MSDYLIDLILPKYEVHLLGGPSGAGKTRWLLRLLTSWQEGNVIFGHMAHPVPWVYVATDRSMDSVKRTLEGMKIDISKIPIIPAWDESMRWIQIKEKIEKGKEELVIVESFGSFLEGTNSNCVKAHLNSTARMLQRSKKTMIGIVESPKMKPYERYENPRQRVSGAAAWAHFSETIFLVEPEPGDQASSLRQLYVCPRNAAMQNYPMVFDSAGDLVHRPVTNTKNGKSIFQKPDVV